MTKKEYAFWSVSSLFLVVGAGIFFLAAYPARNWGLVTLVIGLVLSLLIKDKKSPPKPLPQKLYQRHAFWAGIIIALLLIWEVYWFVFGNEATYNYVILILVAEVVIFNYFGTKYDWRSKK